MVQGLAGIRSCCLPKIERDRPKIERDRVGGGGRNTASCFCQRCQPPQHPQAPLPRAPPTHASPQSAGPTSSPSPADSTPRLAVSVSFSLTPSGPGDSGMGSVVSFSGIRYAYVPFCAAQHCLDAQRVRSKKIRRPVCRHPTQFPARDCRPTSVYSDISYGDPSFIQQGNEWASTQASRRGNFSAPFQCIHLRPVRTQGRVSEH